MTAVRKKLPRRRIGIVATLVAVAAGLVFVLAASTAPLPGSNFEIETSTPSTLPGANLKVDGAQPPALDWANVAEQRQADSPSGAGDESFGQGTKEDTAVPTVVSGQIPPQKSDLKTFGVYMEDGPGGRFLNMFWHRVQEPNGTTNMDFEFNKSKVASANGVTPVRTSGDALIQYDLSRGGTSPTIWLSRWITGPPADTGTASQCEANNALPCWNTKQNLTAAGIAAASINNVAIPAGESDGLGAISARTFGEAQVDLNALQGGGGPQCSIFGSAYLKSRSSDSFTSEIKDFVPPETLDIDQCASVIIRKATDPASDPASVQFGYSKSIATSPASANTFSLGHGQNQTYDNVLIGNGYSVDEDLANLPAGWDFVNVDCSASSGVSPTITGAHVAFDINSKDDILDCTYHNRARGKVIIEKITDDGAGAFNFTSNSLTPNAWTLTTSAAGAAGKASREFADLVPGTYDASETVPAGWNLVLEACSDGSDPQSIGVSGGETVTCTFHNARERGAILIQKTRKHAADGAGDHAHPNVNFTITGGGLPAAGIPATTNSLGLACVDNLLLSSFVGDYTVTETVPAGYHSDDASKDVTVVAEGSCAAAATKANVSFHNTPLTNVTISVDSIIPGGTASKMACNGGASVDTGADGDGSVTLNNLEPSAPAVTVTCTVIVDP
jgi:hypothetical protein